MLEKVQEKNCNNCLFTKNKIVSESRKAEVLERCKKNKTQFICHKASAKKMKVICRGFYDTQANQEINAMLEMLGQIEFTSVS